MHRIQVATIVATILFACCVVSLSALVQVGSEFPNGLLLGGSSNENCTEERAGLIRFNENALSVEVCRNNSWASLTGSADVSMLTSLVFQILEQQQQILDNQRPEVLQSRIFCSGNGDYSASAGTCTCYDDDERGHWIGTGCDSCLAGWGGSSCATDDNECLDEGSGNDCVANSRCTNLPGTFECSCLTGFSGTGNVECVDIDECSGPNIFSDPGFEVSGYVNPLDPGQTSHGWTAEGPGSGSIRGPAETSGLPAYAGSYIFHLSLSCGDIAGSLSQVVDTVPGEWYELALVASGGDWANPLPPEGQIGDITMTALDSQGSPVATLLDVEMNVGPGVIIQSNLWSSHSYYFWATTNQTKFLISQGPNQCLNLDEMLVRRASMACDHMCTNSLGSFTCSCVEGFELDVDQTTCIDVDECATSTHECDGTCTNTIGGYDCSCATGLYLSPDDHRSCLTGIDGGWSEWGPWTDCWPHCGATTGTHSRNRTCTNPEPVGTGAFCDGSAMETESCAVSQPLCIVNGDFSSPGTDYTYSPGTTAHGWTLLSSSTQSGFLRASPAGPDGSRNFHITGSCPSQSGTVQTSFSSVPGTTYSVSFYAAGGNWSGISGQYLTVTAVSGAGSQLTSNTFGPYGYIQNNAWAQDSMQFTATDGTTKIQFYNAVGQCMNIDNVVVTVVL